MFARLHRTRRRDRRAGRSSPASAATVRRCCCCTATRRRTSCGTRWRRCWPSASPSSPPTCPATAHRSGPRRRRTTRRTPSARSPRTWSHAMAALGHERFAVAGHDRGGRVAYRMALDHPDAVTAARRARRRADRRGVGARRRRASRSVYWHWAFLAQPAPLPERLIAADPARSSTSTSAPLGLGARAGPLPRGADRPPTGALLDDPSTVEAICEDYRAGADDRPRARRRRPRPAPHRVPGARRCGAPPARCRASTATCSSVWRPWARERHRPRRSTPATSSSRTSPRTLPASSLALPRPAYCRTPIHERLLTMSSHTRTASRRRARRPAQAHRDPAPARHPSPAARSSRSSPRSRPASPRAGTSTPARRSATSSPAPCRWRSRTSRR